MGMDGRVLADRYAVGELLGRGGMAEVYLATDRVLDRRVAVKVLGSWLADDGTFVERFRREALAAARISHPNLVAVFDAGTDDEIHYIVMEHVPGETLADVLRREGRLAPGRATGIAGSVGDALAVAHAARIVHRDVKPANVMLTGDGRIKVMDLGIARGLDGEDITRTSSILGTAGYVSPEQARGEPVDHRSDIYSLGCVLYEMLTGRQPFDGDNPVAVAYQHVHDAPTPPSSLEPSVPPALEAVVLRAMEKDPAARYQSVVDMTAALEDRTEPVPPVDPTRPLPVAIPATSAAGGDIPTAPTDGLPRRADRPPPRRRLVPLLIAAVALALLGGLAFALFGGEDPPDGATRSPSPSASSSPTDSPSPSSSSPSASPTPPPDDPVNAAVTALQDVVAEGVAEGRISEKAAQEIAKGLEESLEKFADGDAEEAIHKLEDLEEKVDELLEHEEIHQSQEQRIDGAIEELAEQMFLAASSDED
ncbi:MAG: protein kinase domain-containing protein [Actinomycetota bacterium]